MKNQKSGFTLLEIIVAVGIFTVIMTIAMSGLLNLNAVNKDSINFSNLSDNIRFALEIMAKEARTGTIYNCGGTDLTRQNCSLGSSVLTFQNALGQIVTYRLNNNRIEKSSGGNFLALTSSDVKVEDLKFVVSGALSGDNLQPKILIRIKASVLFKNKKTEINLQTLVSSRNIDI